jgi:hypothetical protein
VRRWEGERVGSRNSEGGKKESWRVRIWDAQWRGKEQRVSGIAGKEKIERKNDQILDFGLRN